MMEVHEKLSEALPCQGEKGMRLELFRTNPCGAKQRGPQYW